ncbi:hypothetical protein GCM10012320_32030 [Sinomonas cellulolyticus]|uniref:Secreted protein n=1 Tax=Sinomonas cellulolyticus TaxID=2801916 RepID=A0ABS1JXV2_9MICC|nr:MULTISPECIES: hypothetical protein [Sinomonas]MBL0704221.1 hypothetical protein [Sinomonas cellulolyticus]GHG58342.1 hypothetical protein GCM10012320_32030 [Sinomonas sp. KCTC 49339]
MRTRRFLAAAASAAALASTVLLAPAATADAGMGTAPRSPKATTVVLNPELVPVLVNTLDVRALAPARLTAPGGMPQVSFPITSIGQGVIGHVGGLDFTPIGGGDLRLTNFDINLGTGLLDAKAQLNGKRLQGRVDLFALGPVQPINGSVPSCTGTPAGLTLTPAAAAALGAPSFAGAFIGDACVVAGN